MPEQELAFASAVELARMVRRRQLSPVELVQLYLDRIERLDSQLNSLVTVDAEGALTAARDAERRAGDPDAPPFDGVPIAIKDLHLTQGMRTTFGTASLAGFVPDFDEEHVARIRRAGFILLGKTNVPELGTVPFTESALLGPCRNPWDPSRTPGGSSGGAAATAAAGPLPVAHGSDGGGSARIPASHCALVGLKPTRGRVSRAPLDGDGGLGLSGPGALARHVVDAAALLDVMAGYVPGDPYWAPEPSRPYAQDAVCDPPRLRVGVVTSSTLVDFAPETVVAVEGCATLLEGLGHGVEPLELPVDEGFKADFELLWQARLAAAPVDQSRLEPYNAALAAAGRAHSAVDVLRAAAGLQFTCRGIVGACMAVDVVVSPTMARPPMPIGELAARRLDLQATLDALTAYVGYAPVANATGQPAVSLPLGWSADGLPLGVMVTGRPGREDVLFQLAGQVQRAADWAERRPPVS